MPPKNRAVNSNAFHDNRHFVNNHTREIINFISGHCCQCCHCDQLFYLDFLIKIDM